MRYLCSCVLHSIRRLYVSRFDASVDPKDEKFSDPSWPALPTKCTDKYELLERIGKGAFGWVYKIRDKQTRAIYAAKQLANTANNKKEVRLQVQVISSSAPHLSLKQSPNLKLFSVFIVL